MTRRCLITTGVFVCCFAAVTGLADDLTIPNTFQPNTPARAAEVNDNFTAVESSVDDNAVDIAANATAVSDNQTAIQSNTDQVTALAAGAGLHVYSQGVSIGRLFSGGLGQEEIYLFSNTGYLFLASVTGRASQPYLYKITYYFSGTGCTGTVYLNPVPGWVGQWGGVYKAQLDATAAQWGNYYVPRGSSRQVLTSNSQEANIVGGCIDVVKTDDFHIAQPNDEAVTGVSDIEPPHPYTIGVP